MSDIASSIASISVGNTAEIDVGREHGCALLLNGEVQCWGYGTHGQLGSGATDDLTLPSGTVALAAVPSAASVSVSRLAIGDHTFHMTYAGNTTYDPSTATDFVQTMGPLITAPTLNLSTSTSVSREWVPLAATVGTVDGEFRLDTTTAGNQSQSATAVLSSTGFVAVWTAPDAGSGLEGVYGQRFHLPTATERADRTAGAARPRS